MKLFAKEVGDPEDIISDADNEQKPQAERNLYNEMVTTLQILEKGTPQGGNQKYTSGS